MPIFRHDLLFHWKFNTYSEVCCSSKYVRNGVWQGCFVSATHSQSFINGLTQAQNTNHCCADNSTFTIVNDTPKRDYQTPLEMLRNMYSIALMS